jgi:polyisoprenoid-binding protein YceI
MLVLAGLVATAPLLAHHATQAEFDKNKQKTITGVMTKVRRRGGSHPRGGVARIDGVVSFGSAVR